MLNSTDFMSPNNFGTYGFHQPGTSTAMAAAAAAATAYSLEAAAAGSALMQKWVPISAI